MFDAPRLPSRALAPLFWAVLCASACSDDPEPTTRPDEVSGLACPGAPRDADTPRRTRAPGRCKRDEDCCDRETCNAGTGACVARDACDEATPCPDPAERCDDIDGNGYRECVFATCATAADCATVDCPLDAPASCIAGGCLCSPPCQGGCPDREGCCAASDVCQPLPESCATTSCPAGQFLSVTTEDAWPRGECRADDPCRCEVLPPLPVGDVGVDSAIAWDGRSFVLSAYAVDYGDLVLGVPALDAAGDPSIAWRFLEGVPSASESQVVGDVHGPRGGVAAPGPDVGLSTDIAADSSGQIHIAYRDRPRRALAYTRGTRDGAFSSHLVDAPSVGEAGLHASSILDGSGRPRIAYLHLGPTEAVLRIALARTSTPASASDWAIRDVERTPLSAGDDAPYRDLLPVRGAWPSIAVAPDGSVLVAYADRVDGDLKIARLAGPDPTTAAITPTTIAGDGTLEGDDEVGAFPSLFVTSSGALHLAFMNATRRALVYVELDADLHAVVHETVEEGLAASASDDVRFGADAALVVDVQGAVRIAYQDATHGDLRYAVRRGETWSIMTLAGAAPTYDGTYGFFSDQTLDGSGRRAFVSTYRYFLSEPQGSANGVRVFEANEASQAPGAP